jgi:hypothetical protein
MNERAIIKVVCTRTQAVICGFSVASWLSFLRPGGRLKRRLAASGI